MCGSIILDGREIADMATLRALVGRDAIVIDDGYSADVVDRANCCLCPVDVEATAAKAGFTCCYTPLDQWSWAQPDPVADDRHAAEMETARGE